MQSVMFSVGDDMYDNDSLSVILSLEQNIESLQSKVYSMSISIKFLSLVK